MNDYFVGTFGECTSLIAKLNTMMGYPNPATKTVRYAEPREHASNPGTYLVIMKAVNAPILGRRAEIVDIENEMTSVEKGQKLTREALELEGAFPTETV